MKPEVRRFVNAQKRKDTRTVEQMYIENLRKENRNIMNNLKKGSQSCKVEVLQLSKDKKFIKKWDSLSDASRALNIIIGNISKCLKGKTQSCGGFICEYKNQTLATSLAHSVKPEAPSPLAKG